MPDSFSIGFDADDMIGSLLDVADGVEQAVRPSAQAGAQVFYEEVLSRVPMAEGEHYFFGSQFKRDGTFYGIGGSNRFGPIAPFKPGSLRDAIYQVFSVDNSLPRADTFQYQVATYHVSWNYTKAPWGHWVEHGTSRQPAKPFLRPAFYAAAQRALDASEVTFLNVLDDVIVKAGL